MAQLWQGLGEDFRSRGMAIRDSALLVLIVLSALAVTWAPIRCAARTPERSTGGIQAIDQALAQKDVGRAMRVWEDLRRGAIGSQSWEALLEVGDAARRIGEVAGLRERFDGQAREIYWLALGRARREASLDGVLRVGEALADLGDREGVELSVRVAEALAAQNSEAEADVRAFVIQFGNLRL